MAYKLVVFLHVLSVFGFLLAHGVSMAISFALKAEANPQHIRALLAISGRSLPLTYGTLLAVILFGVIGAFQAHWWQYGWPWAALLIVIVIFLLMGPLGSRVYGSARKAAGLPYAIMGRKFPPQPPLSDEEVKAILQKGNPYLLSLIGYGGFGVIAWLMMFKPF